MIRKDLVLQEYKCFAIMTCRRRGAAEAAGHRGAPDGRGGHGLSAAGEPGMASPSEDPAEKLTYTG